MISKPLVTASRLVEILFSWMRYLNSGSGDTDFHVLKNGVELFGQSLPGTYGTGYTNQMALAAGDTIDFAIGRGADGSLAASKTPIAVLVCSL